MERGVCSRANECRTKAGALCATQMIGKSVNPRESTFLNESASHNQLWIARPRKEMLNLAVLISVSAGWRSKSERHRETVMQSRRCLHSPMTTNHAPGTIALPITNHREPRHFALRSINPLTATQRVLPVELNFRIVQRRFPFIRCKLI